MSEAKTAMVGAYQIAWQEGSPRWTCTCNDRVVATGLVGPNAAYADVDVASALMTMGALRIPELDVHTQLPEAKANAETRSEPKPDREDEKTDPEIKLPAKKAKKKLFGGKK